MLREELKDVERGTEEPLARAKGQCNERFFLFRSGLGQRSRPHQFYLVVLMR
jgi:hypothetical protein